jgi:hypothetical protein
MMTRVTAFHSLNECRKGAGRYHTDDACPEALTIPHQDLRLGSGGYFQCERCVALHRQPVAATPNPPAPVVRGG